MRREERSVRKLASATWLWRVWGLIACALNLATTFMDCAMTVCCSRTSAISDDDAMARFASALSHALLVASSHAYTLYVKSGPDGRTIGDCPFAHGVRLMLQLKALEHEVVPCSPTGKPQWLLDEHEGRMPALVSETGEVITESSVIANYLETQHPGPTPSPAALEEAETAATIFGPFARYCKCVDEAQDVELKKSLLLALCTLDAHLAKTASPFAAGEAMTSVDCFLLPALYHIQVAAAAYKDFVVPPQFESLNAYTNAMFDSALMASTTPPPAMVRWGWANARGDGEAAAAAAAELTGSA